LRGSSLDGRADQYALAATAFQLLTGKPPFENSNAAVVISSHLSESPPKLAVRRPAAHEHATLPGASGSVGDQTLTARAARTATAPRLGTSAGEG
jgi:serine/threonine protein kinase